MTDDLAIALKMNLNLSEDNKELREEIEDWRNSAKQAAGEGCGDEVHCTCVGVLRRTIKEERSTIELMKERINRVLELATAAGPFGYIRPLDISTIIMSDRDMATLVKFYKKGIHDPYRAITKKQEKRIEELEMLAKHVICVECGERPAHPGNLKYRHVIMCSQCSSFDIMG